MKRKNGLLLALVLLLGGIAALLAVVLAPSPQATEAKIEEESERILVYQNRADEQSKIIIYNQDQPPLELKQIDGRWIAGIDFPQADLIRSKIHAIESASRQLPADRLITENPEDLSEFGLENPRLYVDFIDIHNNITRLLIGNRNPEGDRYYVKTEDNPAIYTVLPFGPRSFNITRSSLRNKQVRNMVNTRHLMYLRLRKNDQTIEIVPAVENDPDLMGMKLSDYKMIAPFSPRAVNNTNFEALIKAIPSVIDIHSFIEDEPADYSIWGLDPPRKELTIRDVQNSFSIFVGYQDKDGNYYARLDKDSRVITLDQELIENLFMHNAVDLADRFIFIVNIRDVEKIDIALDGKDYHIEIRRHMAPDGSVDEEEFLVQGRKIEREGFTAFYRSLIGPTADYAHNKNHVLKEPQLVIDYHLKPGMRSAPEVAFMRIDRDFYAAFVNGESRFLVSSSQINAIRRALVNVLEADEESN